MQRSLILSACALIAACAPLAPGDRIVDVPSPNFDERRPNYVILHQTSNDTVETALATLSNPERKVSAHYLIGRDGTTYRLVDDRRRAWHAGLSYWGGTRDLNSASIGIELDNNGTEPFADAQIDRLLQLLRELKERYLIPSANFLGHGDIAPGRKVDPSALFPWERLAAAGFGLWCAPPQPVPRHRIDDATLALGLLGYDLSNPAAALSAFRRHFLGEESALDADERDLAMLNCLIERKSAGTLP